MKSLHIISFIVALVYFSSCQKVITVDLNSTDPRYVIEANVVDGQPSNFVHITRTVNFDQDNVFPTVSGALVIITDKTTSLADTLKETVAGLYSTSKIVGISGHNYTLYVKADNHVFTSSAIMPEKIEIDTMYTSISGFRGEINIIPEYNDPAEKGNYYQFAKYVNGVETADIYIRNDNLINGQTIRQPLNARGPDSKLNPGDVVRIDLNCIDSATYQYFFTLQQTKNQNSASPANPATNITGGALGYFSVHTMDSKIIVLPK